jgi:hypothetical protein
VRLHRSTRGLRRRVGGICGRLCSCSRLSTRKSTYADSSSRSASDQNSEKVTDQTHIPPPDWEALIEQIARQIVEERSPQRLLQVRASLYDLLSHCIDSTTIIKTLTWKLIPKTDDALKPEVIKWAAFYEHRCKMGSKQIFHLEAFVAKYMRLYERYASLIGRAKRVHR